MSIFQKFVRKIQISLKSYKNGSTLHENLCIFMTVPHWLLIRIRNVSDLSCGEIKSHIFVPQPFFQKLYCLQDNVEEYGTAKQGT